MTGFSQRFLLGSLEATVVYLALRCRCAAQLPREESGILGIRRDDTERSTRLQNS